MSAVSSVGGSFIQSLCAGGTSQPAPATAATAADPSQSTQGTPVSGAGEHHHHPHGGGGMFQKIESAVTTALQSAQAGGNSDPNKVIEDAIAKVFGQQGAGTSPAGTTAESGLGPDGDGNTDAPGKADSDGNSARQAFLQTLQSLGVSPEQFHSDFLAAIQQAKGGEMNVATAMQSLPPGSTVDTFA